MADIRAAIEGTIEKVGGLDLDPLPDPPLPAAERNDRRIWRRARVNDAVLVTADGLLIDAVYAVTGDPTRAVLPAELVELAHEL